MELPLQVTVRNTVVPPAAIDAIRAHARKLETINDRIVACRVVVDVPQRHRSGASIGYNVRLDLTVPGGQLVVTRKRRLDLLTAIQDAFDAAERRLRDYASRQRGEVKQRAPGGV